MISDIQSIGIDATLNRVTETYDNLTGSSERTYDENETIKVIFVTKEFKAYTESKDNVKKNDKLTIYGDVYLIERTIPHAIGSGIIWIECFLEKNS